MRRKVSSPYTRGSKDWNIYLQTAYGQRERERERVIDWTILVSELLVPGNPSNPPYLRSVYIGSVEIQIEM